MKTLRLWWSKLRGSFASHREQAFDSEIQEHLDLLAERFRAQGMSKIDLMSRYGGRL